MDVEALRKNYLPKKIRVLFIAEAKPDAVDRFFYYDKVFTKDFLYTHLMRALYGYDKQDTAWLRENKLAMLNRFMKDGYYLVDAVDEVAAGTSNHIRTKEIEANADAKLREIDELISEHGDSDTKIVIIKAPVFKVLYGPLSTKFKVINNTPISFPSTGRQNEFLRQMAQILPEVTQSAAN